MRVLVCGCRDWDQPLEIRNTLNRLDHDRKITTLIHGGARGADSIAAAWAQEAGAEVEMYLANWEAQGKGAGPRRNQEMLDRGRPDYVLAFWDGKSRGTLDMIQRAVAAGVVVRITPRSGAQAPSAPWHRGRA